LKKLKITGYKIAYWLMFLFAGVCIWNSASNFWAASSQRKFPVKVVNSKLTFEWFGGDSDDQPLPYYLLGLDLRAEDGSEREFSWQVEAGGAVYPEEALDVLAAWGKGTVHEIASVRGRSRQLRFDEMEANPEMDKGIGWMVGAFLLVMFGVSFRFLDQDSSQGGPWLIFLMFGMMPAFGGAAFGIYGVKQILTWKPVELVKVAEATPFDFSKPIENVEFTEKALAQMKDVSYERLQYELDGVTYRLGRGRWWGVLYEADREERDPSHPNRYFVDPSNRWKMARRLDWWRNVGFPVSILGGFGMVFIGAALFVRRFSR